MGQFRYMTNRTLVNKAGEEAGKLRAVVRNGSDTAEVDYTCPECAHSEHVETPWKRPFSVKCGKCGFLMRLPKLKGKKK
jgi:hypothetical protein